ncbi:MAG: succinate dehydrogenase, hydrophobic membrane anchor protein [Alphaproteobacteria bacterium]|nr:succinate dehydrogenase, hydrophobic membrane anchor protein [Alphaproteobacteria bacterium]
MTTKPSEEKQQSALTFIRHLISTKGETKFWLTQRVTAITLIPVGLWLITSIIHLTQSDYNHVKEWMSSPFIKAGLLLCVWISLYHTYLGLKVIYEDYIVYSNIKKIILLLTRMSFLTAGSLTLWAILSLSLSSQS